MARMNDYEYDFVMDTIDKKITARGAFHKRTHNGKGGAVKFPSDYMTKKEIKAMSGEVIKYASLKKPMTWEEFKALPDDLKKEYIANIRERFGAPDNYIAEMFGVCNRTLSLLLIDLKCNAGKGSGNGKRKWKKEEFYAWRSGVDENAEVEAVTESEEPVEDTCENASDNATEATNDPDPMYVSGLLAGIGYNCVPVIPKSGSLTFDNNDVEDILRTLRVILSGVHVNCNISWRVVDEKDPVVVLNTED